MSHFWRRLPADTHSPFGQRATAPMLERRPYDEFPSEDLGWLKTRRHFSSTAQDDPSPSGWGSMRVWNDEEIAPNAGFALQVHANIEVITSVRQGTVTCKGSLGNEGGIEAGNVQIVSAGTGIRHAVEYVLCDPRLSYLVASPRTVDVDVVRIHARDGVDIKDVDILTVAAIEDSDVIMVDVL
jgi:hypothetical protein